MQVLLTGIDMYPCLPDPKATDKQRILYWERCLVGLWKISKPPAGWKEALRLRDEKGLTKYS